MLNSFALGITLPVMNVVLLARGLTLSTLALFMALYGGIIVATEIPSGYVSDRYGRVKTFILAKWCTFAGLLLVVFSHSLVPLFFAAVLMGLARAFSSGSLEAVIVDWYKTIYGAEKLHRITSQMSVWETVGLSGGALCSGFVSVAFESSGLLSDGRTGVFLISALLQILIIIFVILWVRNRTDQEGEEERTPSVGLFMQSLKQREFLSILILTFAFGFVLSAIEKYWQPKLLGITTGQDLASILLGIITFLGFMGALGGSVLAGKLLDRYVKHTGTLLMLFCLFLALMFSALAFTGSQTGFLFFYTIFYIFVAMSGIASRTLINKEIPSELRATLLSTLSFSLQVGGLVSSIFASVLLAGGSSSIRTLWVIASGVCIVSIIPFMIHEMRLSRR